MSVTRFSLNAYIRKKLDMHIETAHASSATEAPKDLRCPLCLYHTKNKNCMIDHILLHRGRYFCGINTINYIMTIQIMLSTSMTLTRHLICLSTVYSVRYSSVSYPTLCCWSWFLLYVTTEEPVAPIEVRRPRLSRYLQGLVFRCHKCTFTSSSDEKLHLHMLIKHDDIKPYKCRLCYFDFTQLSELEAHLCDKHQVSVLPLRSERTA